METMLPIRNVARIIVLDSDDAVLLVRYEEQREGKASSFWVPPGGALATSRRHRVSDDSK